MRTGGTAISRAENAIQAAARPASHDRASAADGITGASAAAQSPQPRSTGIAGSASAFAGTVQSGIVPNWSQRIGAVDDPAGGRDAHDLDEPDGHRIALERNGAGAAT